MDLKEVVWKVVDWIFGSGPGQVMGLFEHGNEPVGTVNCGEYLG
jgi:hypothetical protein